MDPAKVRKSQGNPPDCAYYLLISLCVSATFFALGGVFTYMGYWPEVAFHHAPGTAGPPDGHSSSYYVYGPTPNSVLLYSVIGPICISIGLLVAIFVAVFAMKYDCNHEPEEPKVIINELASSLSLAAAAEPRYELVGTQPSTSRSINHYPNSTSVNVQAV